MKKVFSLVLAVVLCFSMAACGNNSQTSSGQVSVSSASSQETDATETATSKPTTDPSGASVVIPAEVKTIVSLAPSSTQLLVALGCSDRIIGYDKNSLDLEGIPTDVSVFDMMQPDMEQLAVLKPDVLVVSSLTLRDQTNPYQQLIDMGICVLCIPTATSIDEIKSSIAFMAAAVDEKEKGEQILTDMQNEMDRISAIAQTITDKKKVYFEIAAAPNMYSFGSGVYLNEMLEMIGAENVLADQNGWLPVEAEAVVAANPDVILTNVDYIEDPIGEILGRTGWEGMSAIQNKQVYRIDKHASSLGNQNIVVALDQMAKAVYPEYYGAE